MGLVPTTNLVPRVLSLPRESTLATSFPGRERSLRTNEVAPRPVVAGTSAPVCDDVHACKANIVNKDSQFTVLLCDKIHYE